MPEGPGGEKRPADVFSGAFESHAHMVALHAVFYNFRRFHETLRVTPAMRAEPTDRVWDMEGVIAVMNARAPKPGCAETCNKRAAEISNRGTAGTRALAPASLLRCAPVAVHRRDPLLNDGRPPRPALIRRMPVRRPWGRFSLRRSEGSPVRARVYFG